MNNLKQSQFYFISGIRHLQQNITSNGVLQESPTISDGITSLEALFIASLVLLSVLFTLFFCFIYYIWKQKEDLNIICHWKDYSKELNTNLNTFRGDDEDEEKAYQNNPNYNNVPTSRRIHRVNSITIRYNPSITSTTNSSTTPTTTTTLNNTTIDSITENDNRNNNPLHSSTQSITTSTTIIKENNNSNDSNNILKYLTLLSQYNLKLHTSSSSSSTSHNTYKKKTTEQCEDKYDIDKINTTITTTNTKNALLPLQLDQLNLHWLLYSTPVKEKSRNTGNIYYNRRESYDNSFNSSSSNSNDDDDCIVVEEEEEDHENRQHSHEYYDVYNGLYKNTFQNKDIPNDENHVKKPVTNHFNKNMSPFKVISTPLFSSIKNTLINSYKKKTTTTTTTTCTSNSHIDPYNSTVIAVSKLMSTSSSTLVDEEENNDENIKNTLTMQLTDDINDKTYRGTSAHSPNNRKYLNTDLSPSAESYTTWTNSPQGTQSPITPHEYEAVESGVRVLHRHTTSTDIDDSPGTPSTTTSLSGSLIQSPSHSSAALSPTCTTHHTNNNNNNTVLNNQRIDYYMRRKHSINNIPSIQQQSISHPSNKSYPLQVCTSNTMEIQSYPSYPPPHPYGIYINHTNNNNNNKNNMRRKSDNSVNKSLHSEDVTSTSTVTASISPPKCITDVVVGLDKSAYLHHIHNVMSDYSTITGITTTTTSSSTTSSSSSYSATNTYYSINTTSSSSSNSSSNSNNYSMNTYLMRYNPYHIYHSLTYIRHLDYPYNEIYRPSLQSWYMNVLYSVSRTKEDIERYFHGDICSSYDMKYGIYDNESKRMNNAISSKKGQNKHENTDNTWINELLANYANENGNDLVIYNQGNTDILPNNSNNNKDTYDELCYGTYHQYQDPLTLSNQPAADDKPINKKRLSQLLSTMNITSDILFNTKIISTNNTATTTNNNNNNNGNNSGSIENRSSGVSSEYRPTMILHENPIRRTNPLMNTPDRLSLTSTPKKLNNPLYSRNATPNQCNESPYSYPEETTNRSSFSTPTAFSITNAYIHILQPINIKSLYPNTFTTTHSHVLSSQQNSYNTTVGYHTSNNTNTISLDRPPSNNTTTNSNNVSYESNSSSNTIINKKLYGGIKLIPNLTIPSSSTSNSLSYHRQSGTNIPRNKSGLLGINTMNIAYDDDESNRVYSTKLPLGNIHGNTDNTNILQLHSDSEELI